MIVQIFFKDIVKEFYFQNVLDGRHIINIYTFETGLNEDIEFFIDINNGIRRIGGKSVAVLNEVEDDDSSIINEDEIKVIKIKNISDSIGVLIFDSTKDITDFTKYVVNENLVVVGRSGNIKYDGGNNLKRYFAISYEDGKTYVIPYINRIYHCGKLLNDKKRIRFGEYISYKKLKLIYMGNILAVNNPDGNVSSNFKVFKYKDVENVKSAASFDIDDETLKFARSPRITHKPITEVKEIDPPPNKKEMRERPLLYTIGPSLTMSLAMVVNVVFMIRASASGSSPIPSAVMALSMLTGAILWPVLTRRFNKKQAIEDEEKRVAKYKQYIDDIDREIEEKSKYNRSVYEELYPSLETLVRSAMKLDESLWNHVPTEEGYLDVRIGRGSREFSVEISIQKERFSLEDDPLKKYASVIQNKYKYLNNVPVSVNLRNTNILGIVGERNRQVDLIKLIITRLAITHSYDEVKFAVIFNKREYDYWEFAKWLPHSWSNDKKNRLIADDIDGTHLVMSCLREIYEERLAAEVNHEEEIILPNYIVFITDYDLINRDANIKKFIENSSGRGFTFVLGYESIGKLPSSCQNIIQLSSEECTIYDKNDNSGKMISFIPDICQGTNVKKIAEVLASVKVSKITEETMVPESLNFMGLYRAKNVADLVIERRWKESQSHKTLEAPIGMGSNEEVFSLNIHEKYHGPHGLIAGTTGSGKSEFIQSLILSLAINYHPYDVSFVLIDYKGGGMANAFTNLPHVSGTITNLEGNQIKRSLISLNSELKRRQAIFKEYGVNHIDSYQIKYKKGLANKPLPHLIIISDEFAELKSQEPEFMSELISTARIGRSLGVHLILATQKPSGVVNDQIWSNTRFRICLKVADKMDSKEMLKRDDAASITLPGRCYVQVGNDEIFKLIQSGYSGAKYIRNGSNITDDNSVSITCIDLQGKELYKTSRKIKDEDTDETQLTAIVDYINKYSKKQGIIPLKLWLPPLPKALYLDDVEKRVGGFNGKEWESCMEWLDPIVALYDEPEKQSQNTLDVNFGQNGHFILYGAPGTGKTTFLQTLIYALAKRYTPEFVNMYIMDFGSRSLSYCKFLPHTADVVFSDDEEKIKKLFQKISEEISLRKKALAEYGVGNLSAYMQASGKTIPAILLIIDNFAAFVELYSNYENEIIKISREGGNYGVYLVMTSASVNAVKRRITENIKSVFTLQLNDTYDYASVLGRTEGVFPENAKGRGLARVGGVVEFQTALAVRELNEAERVKKIKEVFATMDKCWTGYRPKPIPVIPEDMSIKSVVYSDEYVDAINKGEIPLGYDTESVELISIDNSKIHLLNILGDPGSGRSNLLATVIKTNKSRDIWLIDNASNGIKELCSEDNIARYCGNKDNLSDFIKAIVNEAVDRHKAYKDHVDNGGIMDKSTFMKQYTEIILIIDDFENFFINISDIDLAYFGQLLNVFDELGITIFSSANVRNISKYSSQKECRRIFESPYGVIFGSIENLTVYGINVPYAVKKESKIEAGKGYFVSRNSYITIKTPVVD